MLLVVEMADVDSMICVVYECKVCGEKSESAGQLRLHVKSSHIEKDSIPVHPKGATEFRDQEKFLIDVIIEESSGDICKDAARIAGELKQDGSLTSIQSDENKDCDASPSKCLKYSPNTKCKKCNKRFKDHEEFKLHQKCHSDTKAFSCFMCNYSSPQWNLVKIHLSTHNDPETNKCTDCGSTFASEMALKNHWRFHHLGGKHLCDKCGFEASSYYTLFQHNTKQHSKAIACENCEYTCDNQVDLDRHHKLRHEGGYVCKYCNKPEKSFSSRADLQLHVKEIHHGKKCFICDRCNYVAKLRHHLQKHYLMHTGEKPLKCKIAECKYSTRDFRNLKQHMATKHSKPGDLVCRQCDFVTTNQNDYDVHKAMNHMKTYDCERCNFQANSSACLRRHHLSKHVERHEMRYACPHCVYKTNFRESLTKHLLTHSLKDNCHKCAICKESFSSRVELKSHLREFHEPDMGKIFFCDTCPYSCKKIRALQSHILTHSDEKPYGCKLCDYRSRTPFALKGHILRNHQDTTS